MATQPDTPPVVSNWPISPSRARPLDFPEEADAFLGHFPTGQADQQSVVDWTNQTAQQVYENAIEVNDNAEDAKISADTSLAASNFKGLWSDLTGQLLAPASVYHNGVFWQLLYSLADVTASEPLPDSPYWSFISGSNWVYTNAEIPLPKNSKVMVSAISGELDFPLPAMSVGDAITFRNNINSAHLARLTNSTYSIVGKNGIVTAGNDLTFRSGTTKTLVCRAENILEII